MLIKCLRGHSVSFTHSLTHNKYEDKDNPNIPKAIETIGTRNSDGYEGIGSTRVMVKLFHDNQT